jgi:hypothetical protein
MACSVAAVDLELTGSPLVVTCAGAALQLGSRGSWMSSVAPGCYCLHVIFVNDCRRAWSQNCAKRLIAASYLSFRMEQLGPHWTDIY